jgi:hypothetical protein
MAEVSKSDLNLLKKFGMYKNKDSLESTSTIRDLLKEIKSGGDIVSMPGLSAFKAKGGMINKYAKGGEVKKYMGGGSVHKKKNKMLTTKGWGASRKT